MRELKFNKKMTKIYHSKIFGDYEEEGLDKMWRDIKRERKRKIKLKKSIKTKYLKPVGLSAKYLWQELD